MTKLPGAYFILVLLATAFCLPKPACPQNPQGAQGTKQRMVILNVRVTDNLSHAVADVPQADFRVIEDGVPQTISLFSKEDIPLTYALVIDTSGSLRSQLGAVLATGATIVSNNQPDDETLLIRFVSRDKIETVQEFTSDKRALIERLQDLFPEGGQSAVIDAVYLAAQAVAKRNTVGGPLRRRAMILVTDGEDRNSYYKQDQLFKLLGETDVQIYVIAFTKELKGGVRDKAVALLTRLATDTGGRVFFPSSISELTKIAVEITRDIRTQYVIGYVPTIAPDASFHKLGVTVIEKPGAEKRIAVTRVGYSGSEK